MHLAFVLKVRLAIGLALAVIVAPRAEIAQACGNCLSCRPAKECAGAAAGVPTGEVIISEIMYNPAETDWQTGTDAFNREWVEIFNTGFEPVDLGGWSLGDSQDNTFADPFPAGTILPARQAMIVTGDAATFDAQWGLRGIHWEEVANFPVFANDPSPTNETVALRDSSGLIRDRVNYDDANGWPRANGAQGQSIFLLPSGLSSSGNDLGMNWAPSMWGAYGARYSSADGGNQASPGFVETVSQEAIAPSANAAWSIVVLPDTQNYSKSSVDRQTFTQMTEWIRDHKEEWKIGLVLHEGDIVNNNNTNNPTSGDQNSTQQWRNAQASMHVLNGHVPYIMAAGNHDFGTTNAQDRSTQINTYFKATDNPLVDPAQGGILAGVMQSGQIQNAYYDFVAPDGRKMLVIALEWEPRPGTVAWANQIASRPEYADHTAVLLTHAYLLSDNSRYSGANVPSDADGQELWTNLVRQHENFELVFNGHFGGDGTGYLKSTALAGNPVHQLFFNTQFETHGGDGWIRVVEFLDDGATVRVRAFSPLWDLTRTHPQFEFTFQLSQIPVGETLAGDYNGNGVVDIADYTVWRDTRGQTGSGLVADGNGNSVVDNDDYEIWSAQFGQTGGSGMRANFPAVPEPCAGFLAAQMFAVLLIVATRSAGFWAARVW